MPFDLLTLLAVRLGLDVLIVLAFWALMRRYPGIGGPGWWAASAVLSIVGSLGLWMRSGSPDLFSISVANTALCASLAFAWLGLRSYLGLAKPLRWVLGGVLALLCVNIVLLHVWDSVTARQVLFAVTAIGVALLALRDLRCQDPCRRVPELQALRWVLLVEVAALSLLTLAIPVLANRGGAPSLPLLAPPFLFFFLITKLWRMVLFSALVSLRLRQEGDRARQSLQTREADSRALIENLSAGVMVFRPDQTLSSVNAVARRFLGWNEGGANPALPEPTIPGWALLREDGQPMRRHEMPFERVLTTGQPVRDVVLGMPVGRSGEVHWALCNAYPENDANGGLRHVVLTFVDISSLRQAQAQQKALESQLAQSQKMEALGTLAGGVAHDFNNILAAILGNADLARQDLPPDAPACESL
ncbi:MAG: PAS domain-containing protein, partial [Hydrogenophaga sp.]|nr:PAS domain-containing protein [Hydrogenophaga sp.]